MTRIGLLMGATALVAAGAAYADGHSERGSDGQLNIIYWQAPSLLNPYLSGGTKELEAASLVLEPLARYDETGTMVPWLVDEIPTVANGGVSEDLTQITWTISEGIMWSDGTPLTAADAVFTWQYCTDPAGGCAQLSNYNGVSNVEAVDDSTIRITFDEPKPFPYGPFVGAQSPILQQAQFADCTGEAAPTCTEENFAPIGTGPFIVTDFKANDVATFEANENYRVASQPAFATVNFKGGGDAASAARSVLETGEFDYAWNLQVEPEILTQMEAAGQGEVVSAFGTSVERLMVNFTNPSADLGDERGTVAHPHPFLTDTAVTRALSLAIERNILVEAGYGAAGRPTCNVLPAPEVYASTNNDWCLEYNPDEANRLLDEAGWEMGDDGVRVKDGVRLSVLYQTSTNSVRQGTQALIKQMWEAIGVETELRNIDGSVFFGGDQSSPDTFQKFFADIEMYTNNFDGTDPEAYMGNWACSEIPSPDNLWLGNNMPRFCSEEYDAMVVEMSQTAALEDRAALAIAMNDMLMDAGAIIPLIHRGGVSARAASLEGVKMNEWDSELWNIAEWSRAE
ncbi:peptide ABC transporter substrate-binding protein [Pontivivens insulae]|uniref:Glutathione-binding protein GsiB n=1 Tax=Pontivivens insulae TaxID=1639689 RepID=A0A2R8ACR6_9RHOB|nr:peptide ABC transporter substrate-binding protein [Pontivivens insulae]RED13963.1 peptide/nickel transport system substrate-binding protein [Pontivivens insulae]SPF30037.1 Glutathione-binding protein GsiB [Pontivivens insulae]